MAKQKAADEQKAAADLILWEVGATLDKNELRAVFGTADQSQMRVLNPMPRDTITKIHTTWDGGDSCPFDMAPAWKCTMVEGEPTAQKDPDAK